MRNDKVAVILGAGPGLGLSLAKKFSTQGYRIALVSRTKNKLTSLQKKIQGDVSVFAADVTKEKDIKLAFHRIFKEFGKTIDILIYNTGQFKKKSILKITPNEFRDAWDSNCYGAFLSTKLVLPSMIRRGKGTIIFTGATASIRGGAEFSGFAVGKFGLRALSQSMAREFGPKGIHLAHVIIDGQIASQAYSKKQPDRDPDSYISPDSIADLYWQIHTQDPTCWTLETDIRPAAESF